MAFTTTQAAQIRLYLGYPSVWRYQDPALEGVLITVGSDVDASALVVGILANIVAVLAQIQNVALVSAGVKVLDKGDVELDVNNAQTKGCKDIGRMWVGQLSDLFGVPVANDIFGSAGYSGNGWARGNSRPTIAGLG
jgi:hypothetical protein